ncbi:palmitoyltransferase ZDHHC20-B-like isoform X1 [Daphnia pulex]|uniref:palmitoyltransferase ZDHHC20-B-like isoform X1 n=1 Tax=Daphnia pulex TaxID=6669 RepID=UPI001EDE0C32|nr:palmitoyltransferase ZDHHC20-B-like isoform X1 [Daphnia pulex]XP_046642094.1 palmitoyltransferase ZDHHC20-B-like isoform X1 [Daphnia pulicaria]
MAGVNRFINSCVACGNALKWIPVVFIVTVIVWSYYAYVVQLCFNFATTIVQQVFYLVIYHVLLVMLSWSYWQTIFTPVGTVPKQFRLSAADLERFEQAEGLEAHQQILEQIARNLPALTRTPIGPRYCEKCVHIKPDRCHHCSVCGVCVTKMDHHCPWVNNCVGFKNYKFFILFLGYAFIYCIFVAFTSLPYFIQFWKVPNEIPGTGRFHVLFLFFVSIMFSISLVSLWGYHIYLVLHNRSTLEAFRAPIFRSGPDKDGFNLGKYNNFVEVFGDRKSHWLLPVFTSLGDGIIYKSCHLATPVVASTPTTIYSSMETTSPLATANTLSSHNPDPQHTTETALNMGDGVTFPQRHMDEDEDSLLGARSQRWMEEGGVENTRLETNPYHVVNLDPLVQTV